METSLDLSRWRELPRGVGYRRWTIVSAGLHQLLRTRFFKILLGAAWGAGVLIALLGFVFSQSIADGGWFETLAGKFGPRAEAIVAALSAFVLLYPDVFVGGVFTAIFWAHSFLGLWLSLFALTSLVPHLISRDRASNALTVYLSRPLTTVDYLLGKLGMIVGVLVLVWTGPLVCGWLLSMLLSPNRDFIVHSFGPLVRALTFQGIALVSLSAVALGVSALGRSSRVTVMIWLGLWLLPAFLAVEARSPIWIKRASITQNLHQARGSLLRMDESYAKAADALRMMNPTLAASMTRESADVKTTDTRPAYLALAGFVVLSSFVFFRRLRPE